MRAPVASGCLWLQESNTTLAKSTLIVILYIFLIVLCLPTSVVGNVLIFVWFLLIFIFFLWFLLLTHFLVGSYSALLVTFLHWSMNTWSSKNRTNLTQRGRWRGARHRSMIKKEDFRQRHQWYGTQFNEWCIISFESMSLCATPANRSGNKVPGFYQQPL